MWRVPALAARQGHLCHSHEDQPWQGLFRYTQSFAIPWRNFISLICLFMSNELSCSQDQTFPVLEYMYLKAWINNFHHIGIGCREILYWEEWCLVPSRLNRKKHFIIFYTVSQKASLSSVWSVLQFLHESQTTHSQWPRGQEESLHMLVSLSVCWFVSACKAVPPVQYQLISMVGQRCSPQRCVFCLHLSM